jgi:RNA polymerase sigma-70 factor (ECF subfamily)
VQSDAEIIENILCGERAEFAELVKRHEQPVRAIVLSIVHNWHAGQDVVQETFVKAYQRLGQLRDPSQFGSWVAVIARRCAIDSAGRNRPMATLEEAGNVPAASNNGQLSSDKEALLKAVMGLAEGEREAVMLYYFSELNFREISGVTGRSIGTISKQISRGHKRLRKMLKEYE